MAPAIPILVVEDDLRVGRFIVQGLQDEGFAVTWATTGDEALALARQDGFAAVLLDHMLPGRSGLDVARTVRAEGKTLPILMLTARDAPEDRQAAMDAGATDFLSKPFLFDDLLFRLRAILPPDPSKD